MREIKRDRDKEKDRERYILERDFREREGVGCFLDASTSNQNMVCMKTLEEIAKDRKLLFLWICCRRNN